VFGIPNARRIRARTLVFADHRDSFFRSSSLRVTCNARDSICVNPAIRMFSNDGASDANRSRPTPSIMILKGRKMKFLLSTMTAIGFTLANAGAMAQTSGPSADPSRVASLSHQFQSQERNWQQESMSSASRAAALDRDASARDSRATIEKTFRDKCLAHAMEMGAVYSAGVNWPAFKSQAAADPVVPFASMSRNELIAYHDSVKRDAKP